MWIKRIFLFLNKWPITKTLTSAPESNAKAILFWTLLLPHMIKCSETPNFHFRKDNKEPILKNSPSLKNSRSETLSVTPSCMVLRGDDLHTFAK